MSRRFKQDAGHIVYRTDRMAVREYNVERDGVDATYSSIDRPDSIIVIPSHQRIERCCSSRTGSRPARTPERAPDRGCRRRRERQFRGTPRVDGGDRSRRDHDREDWRVSSGPGLTAQKVTVFVFPIGEAALESAAGSPPPSDEIQNVRAIRLAEMETMIIEGRVTDGFSMAGLLLLRIWLERQTP